VIDGGMTVKMIYIDENVIEESIAMLLEDREIASMMRRIIEEAYRNKEKVREMLRKAIE